MRRGRRRFTIVGIVLAAALVAVTTTGAVAFGPGIVAALIWRTAGADTTLALRDGSNEVVVPVAAGWEYRPGLLDPSQQWLRDPASGTRLELRLQTGVDPTAAVQQLAPNAPAADREPIGAATLLHTVTDDGTIVGALTRDDAVVTFAASPPAASEVVSALAADLAVPDAPGEAADPLGTVLTEPPVAEAAEAATVAMRLRNDDVGIDARWPYLPGDQPINAVVETLVRDTVAARSAVTGAGYRPQVFGTDAGLRDRGCAPGAVHRPAAEILGGRSGTVIVCEVVVARGPVFAVTMRSVTGDAGAVADDVATTVYTDTAAGVVGTTAELIADPAPLWAAMVDTLRRDAGGLSPQPVGAPDAAQTALLDAAVSGAIVADGRITLPVPEGFTAPELDGLTAWVERPADQPRFVAVEASAAPGVLSPLGEALAAASGPFTGPAAQPASADRTPCDLVPCLAMTLDDGPSELTPAFLDVLRDERSAATFYMLGSAAKAYPDIVVRAAAEGHQIGNHTWNHPALTGISDADIASQLSRTAKVLRELSGQPVATFRPPYGDLDQRVVDVAGLPAILWSVDTRDWAQPSDESLIALTVDRPQPGAIVLMHDVHDNTLRTFPTIVAGLRDRGFSLVTIDHLFGGRVPGGIVRRGPE